MQAKVYLLLLDAIDELRSNILQLNPNAYVVQLDEDIKKLYDMVNSFKESK